MKRCSKCGVEKPLGDFYRQTGGKDGVSAECKPCRVARARAWQQANRDAVREQARRRWHEKDKPAEAANPALRAKRLEGARKCKEKLGKDGRKDADLREKYGISLADYRRMAATQGGGCAICGKVPVKVFGLVVDHCHKTGKVRGLLCHGCNRSVGMLGDDVGGVLRAITYLKGEPQFEPLTFIA